MNHWALHSSLVASAFFFFLYCTSLCSSFAFQQLFLYFIKSVNCSWTLSLCGHKTQTHSVWIDPRRHTSLNLYFYFYTPPPSHKGLKEQPSPLRSSLEDIPKCICAHRPGSKDAHSFSIPLKRPAPSQSFLSTELALRCKLYVTAPCFNVTMLQTCLSPLAARNSDQNQMSRTYVIIFFFSVDIQFASTKLTWCFCKSKINDLSFTVLRNTWPCCTDK